ncbi:tripartite tricarboxylate transporter TctB family protein [Lacrimispora defluvii]|uniref:Tripartite tricarboxylate transporter TctB family protein n=1 Tax=Lacrimispora defluvii TaxID=2719233 RepID=A0ABX1VYG9_9FIRM|nr:tripartite tricarboxylate transporter TctB family protein [Lacrimispora defluvii]NNJ32839.1 tripartite tricarboxylate transporter TctB family protein [Lacrimispora defluvii]
MSEKKKNVYAGITFLLFAIFIYAVSFWIPESKSDVLGSRFFPRCTAVFMGILSGILTLSSIGFKKSEETKDGSAQHAGLNYSLLLTCLALILYYLIILQLGFVITSIVYLFCQCLILLPKEDYRNKKKMMITLAISVLVPVAINFIFWKIFMIALPAGNLFMRI